MVADVHIPLSGFIYLDEMCESIRIEDEFHNYLRTEFWWIANAYDPIQDIWRESRISPNNDNNLAYEILDRIVTLFNKDKQCQTLFLICDGHGPYVSAYDQIVQEGSLNPEQIVLLTIPKQSESARYAGPVDPAVINEIEAFQAWIRRLTERMRKLKVFLSDEAPQRWLDTARVHYNCVITIPSHGKRTTRIQNAIPGFSQHQNRWLGFIQQALKLRKYVWVLKSQSRRLKRSQTLKEITK